MNKFISTIVLSAAVILAPIAAQAQVAPLTRIHRQEMRLHNGVEQGTISPKEHRILRHRLNAIKATRRYETRRGMKLSGTQKVRLNQRLNRTSRLIRRYKHN